MLITITAASLNAASATSATFKLLFHGKEYEIPYNITNASIKDIVFDKEFSTISINLTADNQLNGSLTINFSKEFYEELAGPLCIDRGYILVDGDDHPFEKRFENNTVTFKLDIPAKSKEIEISLNPLLPQTAINRIIGLPREIVAETGQEVSISGIFSGFCGNPITERHSLRLASFKFTTNIPFIEPKIVRPNKDSIVTIRFTIPENVTAGKYEMEIRNAVEGLLPVYEKIPITVTESRWEVYSVTIGDKQFGIPYRITSGELKSMFVDLPAHALMITIDSKTDGHLTLELPRNVIDSKKEDRMDKPYFIAIGNFTTGEGVKAVDAKETASTEEMRILMTDYPKGTTLIEIAGTYLVTEFPVNLMVVAAIGLIGTLVALRLKGT